jgi:EmrB/QacA subfamily drug resistance transporter
MEPSGTAAPQAALPTPGQPSAADARWGLPLAVLIVGMFMSVLDVTIVNVAIPSIQNDLGSTLEDVLWIATAYTLTLGVVVPLSSWLGDRFGLTPVYLVTLLGFAAGSALCGVAWSLDSLILFRVIQAVPGGILPVITLTIVYQIVPRERIGAAMGMYGLGIVFAPAAGPVLGGYLIEHTNWRLIFYINVPIGILGAIAAYAVLPRSRRGPRRPFDLPGFLSIAFGLFAILLASSKGEDWGWTSYPVLILATAGVLSLALFVVIELAVEHPLLDVRIFRHWPFTNSLLLLSILTVGLMSVLFYVPVFMQQGQGLTALEAGLRILPQALVVAVMMPIAGRLYDKVGPRWLAAIGLAVSAYGTYLLCNINPAMTEGDIITWTCVRAAGMGLAMMPIMTGGIASLPMSKVNQGSAWNNVARQVTGALGLAALSAMATIHQAQLLANRSALLTADHLAQHGIHPPSGPGGRDFTAMYGLFRRTQLEVLGDSYSNIFLVTAVLTALGALLALALRSGPTPHTATPAPIPAPPPATATRTPTPAPSAEPQPTPEFTTTGG